MKIFSLVTLAAILNCLTPVLATSNYQCHNKVLGAQYIDRAVAKEYNRLGQNLGIEYGPREQYGVGSLTITANYQSDSISVRVTIGFTKTKEVLWVKAVANDVEFNCEPTNLPAVKLHSVEFGDVASAA
ncbi:BgTH12-05021 [Blumeria graminis f. sp. triticale]|uniref:Bgt_avrF2_10 n=2 Tax=Blumeria graminis TaxID=34373 RepID=A0A9X9QCS3_BLUGR|nr:BgTH12-05021 [Blumeria graminis f. sp. triticale]VDB87709.1 Bgt_avrF2_10 [Blumeria graminis f. sp. tritici]